jgi:hypothetical protein
MAQTPATTVAAIAQGTPPTVVPYQLQPDGVTLNQVAVRQQLDVAAVHAKALEKLDTLSGQTLQPKHAAAFFENAVKKEGTAQQLSGSCMACYMLVSSTGAFKFQSHIISCVLMPAAVKKVVKQLREGTEGKREGKRQVAVVQAEEANIAAQQHAADQLRLKQQCIRAGLHTAEVDAADKAIANFFYGNALAFSAASPQWARLPLPADGEGDSEGAINLCSAKLQQARQ